MRERRGSRARARGEGQLALVQQRSTGADKTRGRTLTSKPHFSQKRLASSLPTCTWRYTLSTRGLGFSSSSSSSTFFFPLLSSFLTGGGGGRLFLPLTAPLVVAGGGVGFETGLGLGGMCDAAAAVRAWWMSLLPRPWWRYGLQARGRSTGKGEWGRRVISRRRICLGRQKQRDARKDAEGHDVELVRLAIDDRRSRRLGLALALDLLALARGSRLCKRLWRLCVARLEAADDDSDGQVLVEDELVVLLGVRLVVEEGVEEVGRVDDGEEAGVELLDGPKVVGRAVGGLDSSAAALD